MKYCHATVSDARVSTKRDHQICPSDKSEFGKENAVASDFTYGNLFYPYKAERKIKTTFPSLEEGQRPTQTCSVCLYQVTYLEKWISVHLSLIKKAHYKVFGFYPDL